MIALREDKAVVKIDLDRLANAAVLSRPAEGHGERGVFRARNRNREPAVAAAAADRLGEDAIRLQTGRDHIAMLGDRHRAAVASLRAAAAEAQTYRAILRTAGGRGEPTVAARAANRLGKNAVRLVAERSNISEARDLDRVADPAGAAVAAKAQIDRRELAAAGGNREAAVAA